MKKYHAIKYPLGLKKENSTPFAAFCGLVNLLYFKEIIWYFPSKSEKFQRCFKKKQNLVGMNSYPRILDTKK